MVKIISLSGFGKVTTNMFVYETEKDILLVDCGVGFPTEEMLGVDLLIPDIDYLMDKKDKIRGLVLTHAHDDHIGALPYILPRLPSIPIYGSRWALAVAGEKLRESSVGAKLIEINFQNPGNKIYLGDFKISAVEVTHSIPETLHLVIETPVGVIYHAADFKMDLTPVMGRPTDQKRVAEIGKRGVLCLLSDCLRAERPGFTPSEKNLGEVFEREITDCKGRFLVTTMSSNISRFKQAIEVSVKHGRKIVLVGRSVEKNIEMALKLGYLNFPKDVFLGIKQIDQVPPSKITLLVAGSQAQAGSALERIVSGDHEIKIAPDDKIVFSTDYIPGNELAINELIDNILRAGAEVSYVNINSDIHVSGHGAASDLKKLIELVKPKYFLPIGGNYRHMIAYQKLAVGLGYKKENVLLPDGNQMIELDDSKTAKILPEVRLGTVIIDALGVGDVGNVVLRDRQVLSQEGMVVAVILLNRSTGEIINDPEIISRGFVYVKDSEELLNQARRQIRLILKNAQNRRVGLRILREDIQASLEKMFLTKTGRRPMVLSQIIEV
ncbi:ribonuclease J [Candidatus Shapirobacteria bacterium CG08_land_8_20_14_0_20_39_18]|uniref:Ribonuclease J n=1 Tax=Candidatus Shapirobacteria bacterium CG08_land_8_20_14_0_20_39_18 TaxID=1974883 RepID=A0A2M6XDK6_9BACT|nr:MAG: ribonuclease J [Candidatus Shapirobacteria bacterium CG08_land_8_20_14_0_20_39_18]PIY65208.1 MAG: ribonuclease J [Candidatus Shapirobacteria bacterium CG_4_10_14_0_8_um_filter_39_15]